ncbi:PEK protein kinase [Allomyces macrogynus ATCC 38327]|uniref:Eukaryotic translation initiation factor 2-alpha kinase 1 n=1 Tax=Allomyces macrogynus (strain ATCC 38327) TaxID=578462 RepID=A0A0L0SCE2_ALLM3|nr:PEK protein kinase [Allomyces macrogynus ATCC 38327]|eukprot:KNE60107.1 PEK protein kinase [Allomyces macrogynus ATCC 38327]
MSPCRQARPCCAWAAAPSMSTSKRSLYASALDAFRAGIFASTASFDSPDPPSTANRASTTASSPPSSHARPHSPSAWATIMGSGSARESVVSLDTVEPVTAPGLAGSVASSDSWDDSTWTDEKQSSAEPAQPDVSDAFQAPDAPDAPDSPVSERLPGAYWQSSPEDSSSSTSPSSSSSSGSSSGSSSDSSFSSSSSHAASQTTASAGTAFTLPFSLDDDHLPPNHGVFVEDQIGTANADHPERRQQARLLLVALLENFALLYSPTDNKALFQVLCEKLAVMGVITEEDFADSFSAVRSVYKRAFKELVMQALVATRADRQRRGLPTSPSSSLLIEFPGAAGAGPAAGLPTRHARAPAPPGTGARLAGLLDLQTTRYTSDFHEIKRLGKGGFGSVFHVRHKLDGREYAIKKIPVARNKDFERILREVKVLARMDHLNIVRYYSAWLEHDEVQFPGQRRHRSDEDVDLSSDADDYTESTVTSTTMTDSLRNGTSVDDMTDSQLSDAVQFTTDSNAPDAPTTYHTSPSTTSSYPSPTQRNRTRTNPSAATGTSAASSSYASDDDDDDDDDESAADSTSFGAPLARRRRTHTANYIPHRPLMIFVQMEVAFCSLHDYLLHRNSLVHVANRDLTAENNYVFLSILNAVSYIHDRGVSHRDITPRNLFLVRRARDQGGRPALTVATAAEVGTSPLLEFMQVPSLDDIIVKLGDFGLVTVHAGHAASMAGTGLTAPPAARGTPLAASPDTGKLYRSKPIGGTPRSAPRELSPAHLSLRPPQAAAIRARLPIVSTPTLGIGTETYSAPEQLRKRPGKYDWHPIKSDIYSLGIILFELFWPFATQMERIMSLQKLKSRARALPPDFIRQWPQHAALVLWLTAENPALRPTPGELMAVFPPPAVPPGSAPGSGRGRKRTGSGAVAAATVRSAAPPAPSASVMSSPARMEDQVWSPTASVLRDAGTSTASLPARPGSTTPPVRLVRADSDGDDLTWLRERVAVLERTAADQARQLAAKDEEIRALREALATMQADRDGVTHDSGVAGRC